MAYKQKLPIKKYLKEKRVTWDTLYKNYGVKKVNREINKGNVYASMDGKPTYLGN